MDRGEFLRSIVAPVSKKQAQKIVPPKTDSTTPTDQHVFNSGVAPYTGAWTDNEIIHLLKRLTFGAPIEDVTYFRGFTYAQAVDELLNTVSGPIPDPVKTYTPDIVSTLANDPDWAVAVGRTWVNTSTNSGSVNFWRRESLKSWWLNNLINQPRSIEEKMMIFWSTHFAIEFDVTDNARYCYSYLKLIRQYATGNFKAFTKAMSLNPAMLIYLNGYVNTKTAPDENYARELQELFCMGKGPGSQYTEDDVKAAARVLTGYQVNSTTVTSFFTSSRHDTNPKTFSAFYGNTVINRPLATDGPLELDDLMNMIFSKDEVSKYLCRRLYDYFVYQEITPDVEANVIEPLALTFRNNNYDLKPVLAQLFKSEHFFDVLQHGAMIKSGIDFTVSLVRECKIKMPPRSNPLLNHKHLNYFASSFLPSIEQSLGDPPNVSGYPAYYQSPLWDKTWINTDTFTKRQSIINTLVNSGYSNGGFRMFIDVVDLAKRMSNPADPNMLIQDFNTFFLRRTLSQALRDQMKTDMLLTGQAQDYYWTDAWNLYINSPSNLNNYTVVNNRLKPLVMYFLSKLEEYQLM